ADRQIRAVLEQPLHGRGLVVPVPCADEHVGARQRGGRRTEAEGEHLCERARAIAFLRAVERVLDADGGRVARRGERLRGGALHVLAVTGEAQLGAGRVADEEPERREHHDRCRACRHGTSIYGGACGRSTTAPRAGELRRPCTNVARCSGSATSEPPSPPPPPPPP